MYIIEKDRIKERENSNEADVLSITLLLGESIGIDGLAEVSDTDLDGDERVSCQMQGSKCQYYHLDQ